MTFCVGIKVESGLVSLSDSRITSGTQQLLGRKVSIHRVGGRDFFLMTSGLRSVRDKALTYFLESVETQGGQWNKLYKAVNRFSEEIRRTAEEDKKMLEESGLPFDLHAMAGGQLADDESPRLFHIYPQANWVEVTEETPYQIIGESGYGKPILDLGLTFKSSLREAMAAGFLAFDATRRSATGVGFPIDLVCFQKGSNNLYHHCFKKTDVVDLCDFWKERLRSAFKDFPLDWTETVLPPPVSPERRRA